MSDIFQLLTKENFDDAVSIIDKKFDVNIIHQEEEGEYFISKSILYYSIEKHANDVATKLLNVPSIDVNLGYTKTKKTASNSKVEASTSKAQPKASGIPVRGATRQTGASRIPSYASRAPTKKTTATTRTPAAKSGTKASTKTTSTKPLNAKTPLYEAVNQNNLEIVSFLLNNKNIDTSITYDGVSPLSLAINNHNEEIILKILDHPTTVITKEDFTSVVNSGNPTFLEKFITSSYLTKKMNADISKTIDYCFVECKNKDCLKVLTKYFGHSELCDLIIDGKFSKVESLIEDEETNVNSCMREPIEDGVKITSLLYLAIDAGEKGEEIAFSLIDNKNIDINKGQIILQKKIVKVQSDPVEYKDQDKKGEKGKVIKRKGTTLWQPEQTEELKIVEENKTPLFLALEKNSKYVIESLISNKNLDVNTGFHGLTPLNITMNLGMAEYMRTLLKNPSIITSPSDWTFAYRSNNAEVVDGYLTFAPNIKLEMDRFDAKKAEPLLECNDFRSICIMFRRGRFSNSVLSELMYIALTSHKIPLIEALLTQHGLDLNNVNNHGESALFLFINNDIESVDTFNQMLRYSGIDVNIGKGSTMTPLYAATLKHRTDLVEVLLKQPGIDTSIKCEGGKTAKQIATSMHFSDIAQLL
ncbi:hypothetical protein TRFO_26885 [Tritrichomonas foetus]|uniref:DUF3447 domain-containing protein n=1 Tax=Tritrichomonas foetus TaxID=1144522 RepID=A0A1J4K353_9EUKA|nr:hypothetical protein TRFO_26885 [Tritrichomonas foetus]|eukprot:OHT05402.1 hypothetical protein TRFO_26885 [Tritrichomonas foetus]